VAKYTQDNAASVRGVALMATRLGPDGAPLSGGTCDNYLTGGYISFTFTPVYVEGDEIEIINAAGEICVTYKLPDTLKNTTIGLELCDPDPVLTQLLVGGEVIVDSTGALCPLPGALPDDLHAVGYAAEKTGVEANPNGVALRVWASAIVNGKSANQCPYWDYLFPNVKLRLDGDRVVENGNLATVFTGIGTGNMNYGTGPNLDLAGVSPAPVSGAFDWKFPQYADRVYAYARATNAPVGLRGCFTNLGIPLVAIVAGTPATLSPVNATRPADLAALQALGPLGNSAPWTAGQYVLLADGSQAHWDGTAWVAGSVPPVLTAFNAGRPATKVPANAAVPDTLAELLAMVPAVTANPTTQWLADQYAQLTTDQVSWNGSTWVMYAGPVKEAVEPSDTFSTETTITASDQTNADKLSGLGYAPALPAAWTTGQTFTVGTFGFNWTGTAWAPGAHALGTQAGGEEGGPESGPTSGGGGPTTPPPPTPTTGGGGTETPAPEPGQTLEPTPTPSTGPVNPGPSNDEIPPNTGSSTPPTPATGTTPSTSRARRGTSNM